MTRDEAIARVRKIIHWTPEKQVDLYIELGMLTADPPKTAEEQASALLTNHFVHGRDALELLRRNGLKIVRDADLVIADKRGS